MERSDEQLIAGYREGDDAAFAELVRRNLAVVHRFALRFAATPDEAEDVAQETFVRVWRRLASFDAARRFRPWLFEIAKHVALDRLKKRAPTAFSDLRAALEDDDTRADFLDGIADDAPHPAAGIDATFAARELAFALEALPPAQREVVRLHYTDELTFREIAAELGKSLNTVKSWHQRAVAALKRRLKD